MLTVEVYPSSIFQTDKPVFTAVCSLLHRSFVEPARVITSEMPRCDTLYTLRDRTTGSVQAFLMVGWGTLLFANGHRTAVYIGVGASSTDEQMAALFARCLADVKAWRSENSASVIVWMCAADDTPADHLRALGLDLTPQPDGSYSDRSKTIALVIRRLLGQRPAPAELHPFVLPGFRRDAPLLHTPATPSLFAHLRLNIDQGDRLLLVGELPPVVE